MNALAPTISSLISGLLPWLQDDPDDDRARPLSRSDAVRRQSRSPSLSPFWSSRVDLLSFLRQNIASFSLDLKLRPSFANDVTLFIGVSPAIYAIAFSSIKVWNNGKWVCIHQFEACDVLVDFTLPRVFVFFEML